MCCHHETTVEDNEIFVPVDNSQRFQIYEQSSPFAVLTVTPCSSFYGAKMHNLHDTCYLLLFMIFF